MRIAVLLLLTLLPIWQPDSCIAGGASNKPGINSKKKATRAAPAVTVASRLKQVGDRARERIKPYFERQRVSYPPSKTTLVAVKKERLLKVYAPDSTGDWRFICQYPLSAASGTPGPKLRQGDNQVPEGIYRITYLNPASLFHLSLGLDYPNEFDRAQAKRDKRKNLGSEIMIHGSWFSEGCLALGDTAAEDLFVLAADTGTHRVKVVIAPIDFRNGDLSKDAITTATHPVWTEQLYTDIKTELTILEDGTSTNALLVAYADAKRPVPVEKADAMSELIRLFVEALAAAADAATTATKTE